MISRDLFIREITYIKWLEKKQGTLNKHLEEFMTSPLIFVEDGKAKVEGEKPLGFRASIYSDVQTELIDLLAELIGDEYGILYQWIYDYDYGKDGAIMVDDKRLRTANDIYDYFLELEPPDTIKNELLEKLVFESQRKGFLCAIEKLDRLGRANRATKNKGWEDRNALIKFIRSQLITNYQFHTLDDELIPDRIMGLSLWKDLNNE